MLNKLEIDEAIAELESQRNHSSGDCARLANLYSIRDHAFKQPEDNYTMAYSQAAAPIAEPVVLGTYGDSDFLVVVSGKMSDAAWKVMDDLMDTLQVANPRVYESVMRKMRQL